MFNLYLSRGILQECERTCKFFIDNVRRKVKPTITLQCLIQNLFFKHIHAVRIKTKQLCRKHNLKATYFIIGVKPKRHTKNEKAPVVTNVKLKTIGSDDPIVATI